MSADSGATWGVPASSFTGDVGNNVSVSTTPVTKSAVWNAGTDWSGQFGTTYRVRVVANDDPNFRVIPPGSYVRGNSIGDADITDAPAYPVFVSGFFIEVNLVTGGQWDFVVQSYASNHGYEFADVLPTTVVGLSKGLAHPVSHGELVRRTEVVQRALGDGGFASSLLHY